MSTENGSPIVEMKGVTKIYKKGKVETHALRGVDLTIAQGDFVAIWGPSGSGKTTALNLIGALDKPTQGSVRLEGKDLSKMSRRALSTMRRDRIGFVFQAYNLIPVLSAYENAEAVCALRGLPNREQKVMEILEAVGLKGMEKRRPHEMSGGQQQRVAIARAIASDPAVVLADEPTANVDSETAENLLTIMAKLNQEHGVTFIFSTHDPRVMKYARRLVGLVDGKVASDEVKQQG
ncbi:MAG: ABC transporter ATP-binding protein, partial [Proteobacteria bacterium]|nr:ABC transporter ATP-binding protein [Pseudomonadota bacterium]